MEILGPVPVADLEVSARVVRPGARVALCEAVLTPAGADRPVARLSAWRLRTADEPIDLPATPVEPAPEAGHLTSLPDTWGGGVDGYLAAVEWRWVDGAFETPGPACAWTRLRVPLVEGETPSGVQRVMAVADSGSGLSAAADVRTLVFVNTELSVHLTRPPSGDRVWMRSVTTLDPAGVGLARTVLGDEAGAIGSGEQTLFVAPR
jgi:acyl-coenzyme A thioesterase PaaI-like protein